MNLRTLCCLLPAFAVALFLSGCTSGDDDYRVPDVEEALDAPESGHHHHAHGPHGGPVIELGSEDLHAEAVLDEDENILDIYILGSDAKTAEAIAVASLTVSFKHGEETEDFELKAAPQEGDAEGSASRFTITSEDLVTEIHHHPEGASLAFEVDGTPYKGTVEVHHDHGDDDAHGHGDDDDHGHKDGEHGDEHGHKDGDHDDDADHKDGDNDGGADHKDEDADTSDAPLDDDAAESTEDAAPEGDAPAAPEAE